MIHDSRCVCLACLQRASAAIWARCTDSKQPLPTVLSGALLGVLPPERVVELLQFIRELSPDKRDAYIAAAAHYAKQATEAEVTPVDREEPHLRLIRGGACEVSDETVNDWEEIIP